MVNLKKNFVLEMPKPSKHFVVCEKCGAVMLEQGKKNHICKKSVGDNNAR